MNPITRPVMAQTATAHPAAALCAQTHTVTRRESLAAMLGCTLLAPLLAHADAMLPRQIRIVVPFAPGAGTDAMGRLVAEKLAPLLGIPVVVDNKAGASGAIGTRAVANSPADGSTLLLAASPFTTVAATLPSAGYDPLKDFASVAMLASGPLLWVTHPHFPARNLAEWVAEARRQPGRYNYGSAGAGGVNHLALEMLKAQTDTFVVHIPYRGIAPATIDLMGQQLHLMTGTIPALLPLIREGKLRALAVTSRERTAVLPDVPSMAESGLPNFEVLNFFGLMAPRGTPPATVNLLHAAAQKVLALPEVNERFARDALKARPGSAPQWAQFIAADLQGWQQVVRQQNLTIEG